MNGYDGHSKERIIKNDTLFLFASMGGLAGHDFAKSVHFFSCFQFSLLHWVDKSVLWEYNVIKQNTIKSDEREK